MAIPTVGAVGADASDASATNAAVPAPSGVVLNSGVFVGIFLDSAAQTVTPPDGTWTEAVGSPINVSGGSHGLHVFWHRAAGSESGPYTFTWPSSTFRSANALRIDDMITSGSPFSGTPSSAQDNTSGTVTPAVSTTSVDVDCMDLFVATDWGGGTQGSAWTPPAGYTELFEALYGTMTAASHAHAVAGSTGSITATCTGNDKRTAWIGAIRGTTAGGAAGGLIVPRRPDRGLIMR